jgi:hypothetical protein
MKSGLGSRKRDLMWHRNDSTTNLPLCAKYGHDKA